MENQHKVDRTNLKNHNKIDRANPKKDNRVDSNTKNTTAGSVEPADKSSACGQEAYEQHEHQVEIEKLKHKHKVYMKNLKNQH
jgi:hypothetical protein